MRFLIDAPLAPLLAVELERRGHDAKHIRDCGLASAEDQTVFHVAAREDRVLVSADTDFGAILALRRESKPSVILFRRGTERRPERQVDLLNTHLPVLTDAVAHGAIVVFEEARIRIRTLPIGGASS